MARRRLHKPTLWLALPRIPGVLCVGISPYWGLNSSFKKSIWSASVILIGDSWCFDISIQDKRDVIDLPSKSSQDYTSRDSNYYQLWQQESEANEVE